MKQLLYLGLIVYMLMSCTPQVEQNSEDIQQKSLQEITATWEGFAQSWEAEDAKKLMTYYTVDGINIPPASSIKMGRAAIKEFYETLFSANLKSEYSHSIDQIQIFGEHAVEQGHFSVDWMRNDSTSWVFDARSLTHWVKNQEGEWKIQEFIFNRPPSPN